MSIDAELLRAVELAVDSGAALLREKRWHIGSVIPKGDRDYATEVDLRIEETIRAALEAATPGISFLGEEEGGGDLATTFPCLVNGTSHSAAVEPVSTASPSASPRSRAWRRRWSASRTSRSARRPGWRTASTGS